jgi:uncharacterized protein YdaU (DUF1376 family)
VNYYRRFVGDYLRDTLALNFLEDAAYNRLLDHLYATERRISDLKEAIQITRARSKKEVKAVKHVLGRFFYLSHFPLKQQQNSVQIEAEIGSLNCNCPDHVFCQLRYTNKRFEEEIKHSESRINAAKDNGKLGGRPKTQRVFPGLAKPNPEESSPSPAPEEASSQPTFLQDSSMVVVTPGGQKNGGWVDQETERKTAYNNARAKVFPKGA